MKSCTRRSRSTAVGLAVAALSLVIALPVVAQDGDDAQLETGTSGEDFGGESILISARKRDETAQTVPIAVTAVGSQELERQGITDVSDLTSIVPSLNINSSNTETGGSTLRLRGVGTTGNNAGLEGSVGVFWDGVYLSRPGIAFAELVDVERIEVLRGPQGTLFGRNTSAGAIDVKTFKPQIDELSMNGDFQYGNFNDIVATAVFNIPVVSEKIAFRAAGRYHGRDGILNSAFDPSIESNTRERFLLRGQFLIEPIEDLSIRIIGDYFRATERCCDAPIRFESSTIPAAFAALGPAFGFNRNGIDGNFGLDALDRRSTNANRLRANDQEQWGISAEVNGTVKDVSLTYIGSYRDWDSFQAGDDDFVSLDIINTQKSPSGVKLTTHEWRAQGDAFEWLDWMVGAFASYEEIRATGRLGLGADYELYSELLARAGTGGALGIATLTGLPLGTNFPTTPTGQPAVIGDNRFAQDGTAWALFTHNVLDVGPWVGLDEQVLEVVGGFRYNWEKKDGSYLNGNSNPGCDGLITQTRAGGGAGITQALNGLICFPFVSTAVPNFDQSFQDNQPTGVASISLDAAQLTDEGWDWLDSALFYFSYSRGFKAGGFNLDSTAAVVNPISPATVPANPLLDSAPGNYLEEGDASFDSETVDAYEVGLKTDTLSNSVRFNITYFHYDIMDFQVLEFTGIQFVTENVPEAIVDGIEIEFRHRPDIAPIETFEWWTNVIYSDARYGASGCTLSNTSARLADRVCGQQLTNAPKWTFNVGALIAHPLFSMSRLRLPEALGEGDMMGTFNFNFQWKDMRRAGTTLAGPAEVPGARVQPSNINLDMRLIFGPEDARWSLEGWVRNATDARTSSVRFAIPLRSGATGGFIDLPRTGGFTVRFRI